MPYFDITGSLLCAPINYFYWCQTNMCPFQWPTAGIERYKRTIADSLMLWISGVLNRLFASLQYCTQYLCACFCADFLLSQNSLAASARNASIPAHTVWCYYAFEETHRQVTIHASDLNVLFVSSPNFQRHSCKLSAFQFHIIFFRTLMCLCAHATYGEIVLSACVFHLAAYVDNMNIKNKYIHA